MIKKYNTNIKWCKDHADRCFINPEVTEYQIDYQVVISKEAEAPGLIGKVRTRHADSPIESVTIHSQFYPQREAEQIIAGLSINSGVLTIVGIGLGYVAEAVRQKYPEIKIVLIEPDKQLFYLALKYMDLTFLDFAFIYIGYDDAGIKTINRQDICASSDLYVQKSSERLMPALYMRIKNLFTKRTNNNLSDQWKYKKFTSPQCKILFIDSAYVLSKECLSAIQNTGHLTHYIHIDTENCDYEQFVKKLLNDIIHFKPDFVLTINHLGFDKEGRLTALFNDIELPYVSWFVDSPNVVLSSYDLNISDFCHIFVWDDDYIPQVKAKGYKNCTYLPLASDTNIFFPKECSFKYNVSFVGSSMVYAIHKNMKSWVHRNDLWLAFPVLVEKFLIMKTRHVEEVLHSEKINFDSQTQEEDFKAAILWKATQIYRQSGINKLIDFMPTISGDPNWSNILPIDYEIIPERWYYDNLSDFYNQSILNFNMTSLQMTNAVNQRVFDVPACNKFLLTDFRKQILEFFETKENMVWFNDVEEIPDLCKFYLKNDESRNRISKNAYNIVTKYHTYNHRIENMVAEMRNRV